MGAGSVAASAELLNSWKEIAVYLNRGIRTVQRWEADLGLPVRRPRRKGRSAVIAVRSEIDEWIKSSPTEVSHGPCLDAGGFNFLMTEIACGLTYVDLAKSARPEEREKYKRRVGCARKAYGAVLRFYGKVAMSDRETTQLSAGLSRLEAELQELGVLDSSIPRSASVIAASSTNVKVRALEAAAASYAGGGAEFLDSGTKMAE
jgi:hypothetical protein